MTAGCQKRSVGLWRERTLTCVKDERAELADENPDIVNKQTLQKRPISRLQECAKDLARNIPRPHISR
jgi:hypothetical protein